MRKKTGNKRKKLKRVKVRTSTALNRIKSNKKKSRLPIRSTAVEDAHYSIHGVSYDTGYNTGYDKGHDNGYKLAVQNIRGKDLAEYEEGLESALYSGGDKIVDDLLPYDHILPEHTIREIIACGIKQLMPKAIKLLDAKQVKARICDALEHRTPLSVVRLGDGELLTLSQGLIYSIDEVREKGDFLSYAGIDVPDLHARNELARSIRKATIVGIPKQRMPNFLPLMNPTFKAHQLDYKNMQLTFSTINYELHMHGYIPDILLSRRILAIGQRAADLSRLLEDHGFELADPITEVSGVGDVDKVVKTAASREYDIALVSAGIPAVIISQRLAEAYGKVAIDFGHLADSMIKGEINL